MGSLPAAPLHILGHQLVDCGKQRHGEHHSQDSSDSSTDDNGGKYPNAGKTDALANDQGVGDPVVELLEDNNKDQENQCLEWRNGKNQDNSDAGPEDRPDDRDQGAEEGDDPDHGGVRDSEELHADKAGHAQDGGILALTDDVVAVTIVEGLDDVHKWLLDLAEVGVHHLVKLPGQHFLVDQEVD